MKNTSAGLPAVGRNVHQLGPAVVVRIDGFVSTGGKLRDHGGLAGRGHAGQEHALHCGATATCRSRPRIVESRATSTSSAFRGGLPVSLNQPTRTRSPSRDQVPDTTPPATTIGAIQP